MTDLDDPPEVDLPPGCWRAVVALVIASMLGLAGLVALAIFRLLEKM